MSELNRPLTHAEYVWNFATELGLVVMWLIFAVSHLALIVLALAALWLWQVTPADVAELAAQVTEGTSQQYVLATAGFLGLSGIAALRWYARAWRRLIGPRFAAHLTRKVDAHYRSLP